MDPRGILEDSGRWAQQLAEAAGISVDVLAACAILILGWLLARLARRAARGAVHRLARALPGAEGGLRYGDLERAQALLGGAAFWLVLTLALMGAGEQLGLRVLTAWFGGVATYLPRIVLAVLVFAAGVALARFARRGAMHAAATSNLGDPRRVGRLVELTVLAVTLLVSVDVLSIDLSLLEGALLIAFGAALGGAALAFGLGARRSVEDILAAYYVQRLYRVGQLVRLHCGDGSQIEGRVLRIVPPMVILQAAEGELAVPARDFTALRSTLLSLEES